MKMIEKRFRASAVSGVSGFCASMCLLLVACENGSSSPKSGDDKEPVFSDPGVKVTAREVIPADLRATLSAAEAMNGDELRARYPTTREPLTYDATAASGMALIQDSPYALDADALEVLASEGAVITKTGFPSFAYGYKSIYAADLPVYVSADSILEALHRTTDSFLAVAESESLGPALAELLETMRGRLSRVKAEESRRDADLYLSVAQSLLRGVFVEPNAGGDAELAKRLFELAQKGEGSSRVDLFGVTREEDFSQFKPRGHYTDTPPLANYFRAMMWLGRVPFTLVEADVSTGASVFRRRQFDAAVLMNDLLGADGLASWTKIDSTIGAFIGEHDSMTPADMGRMLEALGASSLAGTEKLSDETIIDSLDDGGFGAQRIASRLLWKDPGGETLPLDRVYLLFGQRFTLDSYTFTATTFDRIPLRFMPKPVEVAFSVFANNSALGSLAVDLEQGEFAGALAKTRALVEAHGDDYFEGSLYTRWLGALRSVSSLPEGAALPKTAGFEAKVLNTQLGSWAELRHDTILYVKPSYTTGATCEFPDAYVDPYPEFYERLDAYAGELVRVLEDLPGGVGSVVDRARTWADTFRPVVRNLGKMAENQLTGAEHAPELLAFINEAVTWDEEYYGCAADEVAYTNLSGWYNRLFLDSAGIVYDPTVADVHTDPNSGKILHVGTAEPRFMVVTAETCAGPRAYAGLAFGYGETEQETRMNDAEWSGFVAQNGLPLPEFVFAVSPK